MGNNESHQPPPQQNSQQQNRLMAVEKIVAESGKFVQKQSIVVESLRHRVRTLEGRTEALEKIVHATVIGLLIAILLGSGCVLALLVVALNGWSHHN